MGIMTAIRPQLPLPLAPPHPTPSTTDPPRADGAKPVADPILPNALRQPDRAAALGLQLADADGNPPEEAARKAASKAAQQAYIRASLAAGISPLPLP